MASWRSFTTSTPARRALHAAAAGTLFALLGVALGAPSGCSLNTEGLGGGGPGTSSSTGEGGGPCKQKSDCDDKNACTDDACDQQGLCHNTANDDIVPGDGHPCTDDVCKAGVESHPPTMAGAPCAPGSLLKCDGKGNCPSCAMDSDCGVEQPDKCTKPQCVSSICKDVVQPGKKLPDPTAHDCKGLFCDAAGMGQPGPDTTDKPADDNDDCTDEACTAAGVPHPPSSAGTPCATNGTVCDGMGVCVGCLMNSDCTMGTNPSCDMAAHACISCSDGKQNGGESGIDCGGTCPLKCNGTACGQNTECASTFCADGYCCDTACTDTCKSCDVLVKNGTCSPVPLGQQDANSCTMANKACDGIGGPTACGSVVGQSCINLADCFNKACATGYCRLTDGSPCMDDVACATGLCKAGFCADCALNTDCASGICSAPVCKAKNGEPCSSNSDCIGGKCKLGLCKLDLGDPCTAAIECAGAFCKNGVCTACAGNQDCPGSSCGASGCIAPKGFYCIPGTTICDNSTTCKGYPPKCN
jgi:hypothetical protein